MTSYSQKFKQHWGRVPEGIIIISGILLFALFIHRQSAYLILSFSGLVISAVTIHFVSRQSSLLKTTGLYTFNRWLPLYIFFGLLLGAGLGILTRHKFDLPIFPHTLTIVALVAPIIGMTEEIIFRGFIQGHLRPAGRVLSILTATTGHTLYKLFVILSLSEPLHFNYQFLIIWTIIGGILFGILREVSKSVIPSALAHACFDIIVYGGFAAIPVWVWG